MSARISRSAVEATRFTSTIPHATSKPFPSPAAVTNARIPKATPKASPKPGFQGETPQQKVKRLRAALDKSRAARVTPLEKIILRGRVWADRAHRITATGLMIFTVIAFFVTTYAFIDMARHNRRKKHEYFMEKRAAYAAGLIISRKAIEEGTANQAQIDLVEYDDAESERQERLKLEEEARKGSLWRATKEFIFGGLKKEEDNEALNRLVNGATPQAEASDAETQRPASADAMQEDAHDIQERAKQAFAEEKERERIGGPLDRLGGPIKESEAEILKPKKSWTAWFTKG